MKDKNNFDGSATIAYKDKPDIQGVVLVSSTKRNIKEWVLKFDALSTCTL